MKKTIIEQIKENISEEDAKKIEGWLEDGFTLADTLKWIRSGYLYSVAYNVLNNRIKDAKKDAKKVEILDEIIIDVLTKLITLEEE